MSERIEDWDVALSIVLSRRDSSAGGSSIESYLEDASKVLAWIRANK